jgi:PKD repeat protein
MPNKINNCLAEVVFLDSSWVDDPCRDTFANGIILNCESIVRWEWSFGDGSRTSFLQNPTHTYTSGGYFDVKLIVWSELGCIDSITKTIFIPGPQPRFEFAFPQWKYSDTVEICVGDSLYLINTTKGVPTSPSFSMKWGDGNYSTIARIGEEFSHLYLQDGTYELYLTMEDVLPDGNRCSKTYPDSNSAHRIVLIVNPRPSVSITSSANPTYEDHPTEYTAHLDQKYTRVLWHMNDAANTILSRPAFAANIIWKYQFPGIYDIVLEPQYDELPRCWDKDTLRVEVKDKSLNRTPEVDLDISIYPNPTSGEIYVNVQEGISIIGIQVLDINGKQEDVTFLKKGENAMHIDASTLARGNYLLRLTTSKGIVTHKISILRE